MMRIIAGTAGGILLSAPSSGTRPTQDRVREAIFSALQSRGALEDACVLDLFAGSGAYGFESLSRGALSLDLVDYAQSAAAAIRKNQAASPVFSRAKLYVQSALSFLASRWKGTDPNPQWELVFIDPPYIMKNQELLEVLTQLLPLCDPDAWIVVERSARDEVPEWNENDWEEQARKLYGESAVYFLRPALGAL
ncbi:RsmD family RNA methyltransferase [Varibaculum vaginae]|uniref:RsmD family RNA methyltransferase n=1 Tax=Varibaculum vaginae TaxID=2364797 RepID=UPI000F0861C5|nr:RsmD family RNA methyltransferase [Varibaculum vaginae]